MGFFDALNEFANAMASANENRYTPDELRTLLEAKDILIKHNKATAAAELNDVIRAANSGTVSSTPTTTASNSSGYSAYEIKNKLIKGMLEHSHVHQSVYDGNVLDYKGTVFAKVDATRGDRVKVLVSTYSSTITRRNLDWSKPMPDCVLITAIYTGNRWSVSNVEKGRFVSVNDTMKHFIDNFQKEIYNL